MDMDWSSIVPALITGILSLVGVYAANRKSSALIAYRIEQLEKKQNLHKISIPLMSIITVGWVPAGLHLMLKKPKE